MSPSEFIAAMLPAAQASERLTGIPAAFTVAQAALESTWGGSQLARDAMNLFSIKADRSWAGPVVLMNSAEVVNGKRVMLPARWRKYPSWQACMDDRARFFKANPRYEHCLTEKTAEGWARAVQAAGYATDPAYADKIIAVMRSHKLI
jgi:flagellar protein FlgJ